jgi:hypothetical protein
MVGLPKASFAMLEELVDTTPWFAQQLDAYRLAVMLAVSRGWRPSTSAEGFETKFSVSSLDPDGTLRDLVLSFVPEASARPYDAIQRLAVAGVAFLHQEVVVASRPVGEILTMAEDPSR